MHKALWQLVKYGVAGVLATLVQTVVFYLLAATCLKCLTQDDLAVRYLGLPGAVFTGEEAWYASRGMLAAFATAIAFTIANVFCWFANRVFVFKPGRWKWYVEFLLFYGAASLATLIAIGIMKVMIDAFGMMTTFAVVLEIVISFAVNFVVRKFYVFKE